MLADVRTTIRQWAKAPGFSLVLIVTMAVGIGANVVTFSWIKPLLLDPLPGAADPARLVAVESVANDGRSGSSPLTTSFLDYRDFRDRLKLMDVVAMGRGALAVGDGQKSERVWSELVSGNFFDVLGIRPEVGRFFSPDERTDAQNSAPVAVISHSYWVQHYQASASALGSSLRIDRVAFTIIGVAPEDFHGTQTGFDYQIWLPLTMYGAVTHSGQWMLGDRNTRNFTMLARLQPGATREQALAEAAALALRMQAANGFSDRGVGVAVLPLWQWHFGPQSTLLKPVAVLMAASALLLLIVCANVANLLLARATGRRRELGVRLALGAGPWRLGGQLLVESALLALGGALVGLLAAEWLRGALRWLLPAATGPAMVQPPLFGEVLGFTVAVAALAALLAGIAPALHAARSNVNELLMGAGRGEVSGAASRRLKALFVIFQVALAVIALVGAGIFLQSFRASLAMAPGFVPEGQVLARFDLSTAGYTAAQADAFYQRMTSRLQRYAGVSAISYADTVPLGTYGGNWEDIRVDGYQPSPGENMKTYRNLVGPGYFDVMRIPLVEGRDFNLNDEPGATDVAIVSEAFVRRYLAQGDPLGHKLQGWGKWFTIVGVVKDIKIHQVSESPAPFFYIPIRQIFRPEYGLTFHLRTSGPLADAIGAVRREAAAIDPALTMFDAQPMSQYIAGSLSGQKIAASILSILGSLGLILAALGLYSVMAYAVAQRTREIGTRMALGAMPSDVIVLVLGEGMGFAAIGLAVGVAAALALTRLATVVFGAVHPADPLVYAAASLMTLAIALAAVALPSWKATAVDPVVALRNQ